MSINREAPEYSMCPLRNKIWQKIFDPKIGRTGEWHRIHRKFRNKT